jgi:hypothetical protein
MHELLVVRSIDVVRKVDEKLSEATLGGCVVTQNGREGSIAKRLGETLA